MHSNTKQSIFFLKRLFKSISGFLIREQHCYNSQLLSTRLLKNKHSKLITAGVGRNLCTYFKRMHIFHYLVSNASLQNVYLAVKSILTFIELFIKCWLFYFRYENSKFNVTSNFFILIFENKITKWYLLLCTTWHERILI